MKKDIYAITIPSVLTELFGKGNVRTVIEEEVRATFKDWAHPELVAKIQVTKPRTKKNGEENG